MNMAKTEDMAPCTFDTNYIQCLKTRNSATVEHFVSYFRPRLQSLLRKIGAQPDKMEDLQQETFLRLLGILDSSRSIRYPERFGGFTIPVGERAAAGKTDLSSGAMTKGKGYGLKRVLGELKMPQMVPTMSWIPSTGYSNIKLRGYVTFNQGGTLVSQAHDAYSNINPVTDEYNGIYWLPFGATTAPNTLRLEVTATDASLNTVIILNDIVNIDRIPNPPRQAAPTTATTFGGFHYWDDPTLIILFVYDCLHN
jgi:hypothetical protein